jgi:adenylate kinase
MDRLASRRQCRSCGEIYHLVQEPPRVAGTCDLCQGTLVHRSDDYPEIMGQRIAAYHDLTGPVLAHYAANARILDGTGAPEEVVERIRAALDGVAPVRGRKPRLSGGSGGGVGA